MISFIVPIYNNKETVSLLVQKLVEIAWQEKISWEIIAIDDVSTDGSIQVLQYLKTLYPQMRLYLHTSPRIGFYLSAIEGIEYAQGTIIGVFDASLAPAIEQIPLLVRPLLVGKAEVVLGSRFSPKSSFQANLVTKLLMHFLNKFIVQPLIPLSDPLSNFFFAKREVFTGIAYSPVGVSVGLEVFLKGSYQAIQEIACDYSVYSGASDIISVKKIPLLLQQLRLLKQYKIENKET